MKDLKKYFPALSHTTYLNTPANGLLPLPVLEWRRQQDIDFINQPDEFRMNHKTKIDQTKEIIAEVFDTQTDEVAMVPNFSFGLNMVLEGLDKNQKILLIKDDYPSVNWPVQTRFKDIFYAVPNENMEQNIYEIIQKQRPTVFAFSLVQWLNGIKIDFNFIKKLKSDFPELLLIGDGTQYLGVEEFSFEKSGLDVFSCSGYKWLTAGFGNGFLVIRKNARDKIKPKTVGFNSAPNFSAGLEDVGYMNHFEPGHQDSLSYGSIAQSLLFSKSIGFEKIYNQIKTISEKAKIQLGEMGFLEESVLKRPIHSMIFNLKSEKDLSRKLSENGISSSPRGGGIRIGFHYYNDENDLDKLIECLKK